MTHFFLDDIRSPSNTEDWVIARTYREAVRVITYSPVFEVWALDHDLGGQKSGYDFFLHIAMQHSEKLPKKVIVHSSNVVASERMIALAKSLGIKALRGKVNG